MASWIKRHPLAVFYIFAYAITWLAWLPQAAYSRGLFPFDSPIFYFVGGIGPMLAAYIVLKAQQGERAIGTLFAPLLRWKTSVIWYVIAVSGFAVIGIVAAALGGDLRNQLRTLDLTAGLIMTFIWYLIAAIPEEVAWRGFALPRLQTRYSALVSSLIIGLLWALWHLPLLLNTDNVMSTYPKDLFLIEILAASVIYTWLFNSTRGSVLIVTIYHCFVNTVGAVLEIGRLEQTVVMVIAALLIILVFGASNLSRLGRQTFT